MMKQANRNLALTALLAAVTVNHYTVAVAGVHVKLEHVVVVLLAAGAIWAWLRGARLQLAPLLWIPVFVGITLIASMVNAPDRLASLRYTGLIALVSAGAGLVYWLANTPARFHTAVRLLVALGGLEAAISFLALAAAAVGSSFGTQPGFIGTRVVYGTLWEPNVLGSYLAAAGTLALALLMSAHGRRRAAGLTAGLALILAALGLSSTRAAWLGFLVGALVVLLGTARPAGLFRRNGALALLAAGAALGFLLGGAPILFPNASLGLLSRVNLSKYDPQTDPSLQARATSTSQSLAGIVAHPIIGTGAGSYAADHVGEKGAPGWIPNLELHLLYDSGLLGLLVVLGGWGFLAWRAWRGWRAPAPPGGAFLRPAIIGLLGANAALLIAYQATEATWLGYTWVYIGLLARAATFGAASASRALPRPVPVVQEGETRRVPAATVPGAHGDARKLGRTTTE